MGGSGLHYWGRRRLQLHLNTPVAHDLDPSVDCADEY